ncbi:hypothetical protein MBLNU230_g4252t1 [Neophaeotheca triangularis]
MKVTNFLATALFAASSATASIFGNSIDVAPYDDSLNVPGENPLAHCQNPKDDILALKSVDLSPNPPKAGTKLTVTAAGILSKDVGQGATVHLQVKYGLITIIKQEADLCNTVKNVDLECPIKKGETKLTKEVDLPKEIPPGKYTVIADVYTEEKEKVTCLTATVQFSRGKDGATVIEVVEQGVKQDL